MTKVNILVVSPTGEPTRRQMTMLYAWLRLRKIALSDCEFTYKKPEELSNGTTASYSIIDGMPRIV